MKDIQGLKEMLDEKVELYNRPGFIENDPISIPHRFRKKQDIEIAGFFAAVLAWGQRTTIIRKTSELMSLMDDAPHDFLVNCQNGDLARFRKFVHRTFNPVDARYFVTFLSDFYKKNDSLEHAFVYEPQYESVEPGLKKFHDLFFSLKHQHRTRKHVSTPARKSACKRLNMYLRWMVRNDQKGVDFGLWKKISPAQLVCPCDLHVGRIARQLRLIKRKNLDWQSALELTANLRKFDPVDPVKYDFALFGMGITETKN